MSIIHACALTFSSVSCPTALNATWQYSAQGIGLMEDDLLQLTCLPDAPVLPPGAEKETNLDQSYQKEQYFLRGLCTNKKLVPILN